MPDYQVASYWPFIINAPLWTTMVYLVVYGQHITYSQRLIPGFLTLSGLMIVLPLVAKVGGTTGFYICDVVLILIGISSGMCQGTAFQMASAFPPSYMAAVMLGNGLAGFGTNLLRAGTLLLWPADQSENNEFIGAFSLFMIAFAVLFSCGMAQMCLRKNPFAIYYLKQVERRVTTVPTESSEQADLLLNQTPNSTQSNSVLASQNDPEKLSLSKYIAQAKANIKMTDGLLAALIYVFVLTFICFPGLIEDCKIKFMQDVKNYDSWFNLLIQSVFNIFDSIGRYLGGVPALLLTNNTIKISSLTRTVFLATCLMISFEVPPSAVFSSDWFVLLNLALFSITNGYISTLCAIKAPMSVEGEAKGQVGGFVGITISTGIVLGSLLAFLMAFVIKASPV